MSLPTPNLDDRRFQDLVDDAKRRVQQQWPEWTGWTDHNVHDPGVTLIETVASTVEQLLYRLNRVPDRMYIKFLELIGLQLQPPTAAVAPVTFWLSAPQTTDVIVPPGTEVSTERADTLEPVVFATSARLDIVATSFAGVATAPATGAGTEQSATDFTDPLHAGGDITLFSAKPAVGDCFYVGLSTAAPNCAITLRFDGKVWGTGIVPDHAPIEWHAWDGTEWSPCEVGKDTTGGFNRPGDVVLHLPAGHRASIVSRRRAGWVRCRVTEPVGNSKGYSTSPRVNRIEAFSVGGTIDAVHAEEVTGEILGTAEGVAGQRLALEHFPVVLSREPTILEVVIDVPQAHGQPPKTRVEEWLRVDSFAEHGPDERIFTIEPATGAVRLPPAVREPDGRVRRYGAIPEAGAILRIRSYRTGGGRRGNVAKGALRSRRTSLPLIASLENRRPATGGVDPESIEEAKDRGPLMLRTRERAVTASDFEHIALTAAPDVARVRCTASAGGQPAGVHVLVVPRVDDGPDGTGRLRYEQLQPRDETRRRIVDRLDARRLVGVDVTVGIPVYRGVTVVTTLQAMRRAAPEDVKKLAVDALYRYFHPVIGGPTGEGWPFGRPIQAGEVHAVLQRVPGVDFVESVELYTYSVGADTPDETRRGNEPLQRIDVPPDGLVFSFGHDVRVEHRQ